MEMDFATCNVVYVDRAALEDTIVRRGDARMSSKNDTNVSSSFEDAERPAPVRWASHMLTNINILLHTFSEGSSNQIPLKLYHR